MQQAQQALKEAKEKTDLMNEEMYNDAFLRQARKEMMDEMKEQQMETEEKERREKE